VAFLSQHWLTAAGVLALAGLVGLRWAAWRRRRDLARYADPAWLAGRVAGTVRRASAKTGLVAAGLALVALALAGPLYGERREEVTARGADVVLAVDVSPSMGAADVKPSRLDRAVRRTEALLNRLGGHRVALVAFSGDADPVVPLTLDRDAVRLALGVLEPGTIPRRGSSLEAAVAAAARAFGEPDGAGRALVVLSDGEATAGSLERAVTRADNAGIRVYAVGVGETAGAPIPVRDADGRLTGYKRDKNGNLVRSRLEPQALARLAAATGGTYATAGLDGGEVGRIAEAIHALAGGEGKTAALARPDNRYQWPLGAGLLLLAAELLLPAGRRVTPSEARS
jgi:Ca-activated chloride channel family protein